MRQLLTERYRERLAGVLSCYDRIIVTGTLPGACYAKGMMGFLSARQIRVFDYPRFAEPLRDRVRDRAAELASAAGITIEHIAKKHIRKEDGLLRARLDGLLQTQYGLLYHAVAQRLRARTADRPLSSDSGPHTESRVKAGGRRDLKDFSSAFLQPAAPT